MPSTNKTPNYDLSQFIAGDKPAWRADINVDFLKIDTALKNIDDKAGLSETKADEALAKATSVENLVSPLSLKVDTLETSVGNVVVEQTSMKSNIATNAQDIESVEVVVAGLTNANFQTQINDLVNENKTDVVTVTASGWLGAIAPFTQTIQLTGVVVESRPIVDIEYTAVTIEEKQAQLDNYSKVNEVETGTNTITLVCWTEKPVIDFSIKLRGK